MRGSVLLRQTWTGLKVLVVFTVLLGVAYPLAIWGVSRMPGLYHQAEGSVVIYQGHPVGSALIGLNPVAGDPAHEPYFHTRPSAEASDSSSGDRLGLDSNTVATSGGSNLAQNSNLLRQQITARRATIAAREQVAPSHVPADAVTASASGLDPDISPTYAYLQCSRVARMNGLPVAIVRRIVADDIAGRPLGVLGEPTVNVLVLNLAVAHAAAVAHHRLPPGR